MARVEWHHYDRQQVYRSLHAVEQAPAKRERFYDWLRMLPFWAWKAFIIASLVMSACVAGLVAWGIWVAAVALWRWS